jgi:flavodoxin
MKKILIVYGTNSGATEEICEVVRDLCTHAGHVVALQRASETSFHDMENADMIIAASCTWDRFLPDGTRLECQLQEEWRALAEQLTGKTLPRKPFAIIGVGDSRYTHFAAAADHLRSVARKLTAAETGDILRVDRYYFRLSDAREEVRAWGERLLTTPALAKE